MELGLSVSGCDVKVKVICKCRSYMLCMLCCVGNICRGGLVSYDAGFTHLRSRVQFPALVTRRYVSCVCTALDDNTNQFHRLLFIITTY